MKIKYQQKKEDEIPLIECEDSICICKGPVNVYARGNAQVSAGFSYIFAKKCLNFTHFSNKNSAFRLKSCSLNNKYHVPSSDFQEKNYIPPPPKKMIAHFPEISLFQMT